MPLSDIQVRKVKPKDKPFWLADAQEGPNIRSQQTVFSGNAEKARDKPIPERGGRGADASFVGHPMDEPRANPNGTPLVLQEFYAATPRFTESPF